MTEQTFQSDRRDVVCELLHHLSYQDRRRRSAAAMVSMFIGLDPLTASFAAMKAELACILDSLCMRYSDFHETESYRRLKALTE